MALLETKVPEELAGQQVLSTVDYRIGADQRPPWLEAHDMVALELTDGRALIRPSGTEPKLKIYVDLRGQAGPDRDLDAQSAELLQRAAAVAEDLAAFVGLA
jgi:phosphomannomutase